METDSIQIGRDFSDKFIKRGDLAWVFLVFAIWHSCGNCAAFVIQTELGMDTEHARTERRFRELEHTTGEQCR